MSTNTMTLALLFTAIPLLAACGQEAVPDIDTSTLSDRIRKTHADTAHDSVGNALERVGAEPGGLGKVIDWNRQDEQINLVVMVAANDSLGVAIRGLKKGDVVQVFDPSGVASFDKGKQGLVSSLVGLIAAGGKHAVDDAIAVPGPGGAPLPKNNKINGEDAAQLIKNAGSVFEQLFAAGGKRRDAFGEDPGSGKFAKHEGGVVLCLPNAGGVYYGGSAHGLKDHKRRTDDMVHPKLKGKVFYPVRGDDDHNTRTIDKDGVLHILAWDSKHEDNTGHYRLFITIKKP